MIQPIWLAMGQAPAGGAGGPGGAAGALGFFLPMVLIFVVFWFLIIRPQQKQQKLRQQMLESLKSGDRIVTSGGLYVTVKDVKDDRVVALTGEGVKLEIAKQAISGVVDKSASSATEKRS
jgi:preprotein translocase subunit YajC